MTEYILSQTLYATDFHASAASCWGNIYTYDFKIDIRGNVYVKSGSACYNDQQPQPIRDEFTIIDNIAIPEYIIELFKNLIKTHCISINGKGNVACRLEKTQMFFDIVKQLKKSIENISKNSQNITDIKTQLELYQNKNKILEKELRNTLNKTTEKIQNIQTDYDNTLKNNTKINTENTELREQIRKLKEEITKTKTEFTQKIQKLESDNRFMKNMRNGKKETTSNQFILTNNNTYTSKPIYTTQKSNLDDCWSNTGGTTIYTKPNAQNRMVYNETSGIYEPGEDD